MWHNSKKGMDKTIFQKNKYLEDLGLKRKDYGVNWISRRDEKNERL